MTLVLDSDAVIRDVTVSNTVSGEFVKTWLGRPWIETVAESGIERVRRSLADARVGGVSAYNRIVQRFPSGLELPIEYTTVRLSDGTGLIAIGRNLQASSELQSRLMAAQQAMERDYWKLREVETRYRLLFDASNEAVLVLNSSDLSVVEANPAAIRALGLTRGWDFLKEMAQRERDAFCEMLSRVRENGRSPGGVYHIGPSRSPWILRASLMSDKSAPSYMIQLVPTGAVGLVAGAPADTSGFASLFRGLSDGLVMLDAEGVIRKANPAFLEMVHAGNEESVVGHPFDHWLQRDSAGASELLSNLRRQRGFKAMRATLLTARGGVKLVEISAGGDRAGDPPVIGLVIREATSPAVTTPLLAGPSLPTFQAVGSKPLKDLVQAAVEVIERHYVDAALRATEGNRTAAAERLGLSRQSLYAKINRYHLEVDSDEEAP